MPKFNSERFKVGGGLLNEASKKTAPKLEEMVIVYKSLQELIPNDKNKYTIDGIQELADNIRTVGRIQQPIIYLDPPLEDGRNKIIAGHRRYFASELLSKEQSKWGETIPCTPVTLDQVQLPISDESKEEYLILTTNIDNRNKTSADLVLEYRQQKAIYEEAKENGYVLTGKMRNIIAKDLGISPAQAGKIEYIESHATDPVKDAVEKNILDISDADKISHKATEEQHKIIDNINDIINNSDNKEDKEVKKEIKKTVNKKIIDDLDEDFYTVDNNQLISEIKEEFTALENLTEATASLNKKDYAKLLAAKEKLIEQIRKVEQLINI